MEGWIEDRWLAEAYGEKEEEALDYSVLSVAVMTLALILLVEVIRHRLDHEAKHRPFFKVVLETTYSELATLGLVELFVFLLLRYYKLKYKARKDVFAEVHFALFYTAIFNAFQSVICAIASRRVSDKMWVKTEHLELDHYIEIREEFDRVEEAYLAVRNSVPKVFRRVWTAIRHPGLRSRYMKLLVQVRFHQLRIHFLENNNLPLTFKVSEYLKRSEETVLMHMVHVNGTAWLLLTGGFNFLYFIIGMVAYSTGSPEIVGNWLTAIFFSMLIMFIIICVMLYMKMTRIFETILKLKHCEIDDQIGTQRQRELFWYNEPHLVIALIQFMQFGYAIALAIVIMFWDNLGKVEPYYYLVVITCCYAIFVFVLAKVLPQFTLCTSLGHLVNKEHLNETLALHRLKEAQKRQKRKLVQLTFGEDLDESIICTKMKEKCKATGDMLVDCKDNFVRMDRVSSTAPTVSSESVSENQSKQEQSVLLRKLSSSENMSESGSSDSAISRPSRSGIHKTRQSSLVQSALLAELVKMDTSQLRQQLPERTQARLSKPEEPVRPRRANRRKSVSDGVQAMARMGNLFNAPAMHLIEKDTTEFGSETVLEPTVAKSKDDTALDNEDRGTRLANRRANRKKSVSASGIIQAWRQVDEDRSKQMKSASPTTEKRKTVSHHQRKKSASASDIIHVWHEGIPSLEEGPKFVLKNSISQKTTDDPVELHRLLRKERLSQQRRSRRKAVSASAVIQSWKDFSVTDPVPRSASPPIHHSRSSLRDEKLEGTETWSEPHELLPEKHKVTSLDQKAIDAWMGNEQQPSKPPGGSVNLSDVHLINDDSEDLPICKKSVGFSDLEASQDDDSVIKAPQVDDDLTVDTGKSVGDLSDVGIVPRLDFESLRSSSHWEKPWHVKMRNRLSPAIIREAFHGMFTSERYPLISHVFGTTVVFFLIGMRVESFNAIVGLYAESEYTWELRLNASFWWQVTWYLLFIIVSALVMWSVHPSANKSFAEKAVFGAAIIDIFLTVTCLTLLFVADTQRCCDDEASYEYGYRRFLSRLLGEGSISYASDTGTEDQEHSDSYGSTSATDDVYKQCCPFWGFRTFGGLGNIEPFTALIALRVLRFQAAKFILSKLKHEKAKDTGSHSSTDQAHSNEDKNHEHHACEHDDHRNIHDEHGTILELWQRAINQHPQIVETYGHFSAELFQTMLGLEVNEYSTRCLAAYEASPSGNDLNKVVQEADPEKPEENPNPHYKLNGEQYSCLSAECQGIILAGKLGKPVKSMMNLFEHFSSDGNLPTLHEDSGGDDHDFPTLSVPKSVEFAVDDDRLVEEQNDESVFIAPNARLIRSMRRCDRRLYPLLKQWITVDVVITDYEIVYFEIENDSDEQCLPDELRTKGEALRLALQATKGGKGLRLADVAAGRKVVGHLDLTDVTQVHVERDMPLFDVSHLKANEVNLDVLNQVPSEYWQKPASVEVHTESRALRWARVKEDRLKLLSKHGTLMLRFYSDLNDVESRVGASRADDEDCGHLKKNIAFQWAQTVAHICGVEQLKQPLPHFGNNGCDELRDYLEIVHHRTEETKGGYRRGRGGNVLVNAPSVQNLNLSESGVLPAVIQQAPIPKPKLRYSKSFGDVGLERATSLRLFRRSVSIGEQDSNPNVDAGGAEAHAVRRRVSGDPNHDTSCTQP